VNVASPPPVTLTPATHRFFDALVTALASQAALTAGMSTQAGDGFRFLDDRPMRISCLTGRSQISQMEVELRPAAILTPLASHQWPASLELTFDVVNLVAGTVVGQATTFVLSAPGDTAVFTLVPHSPAPREPLLSGMQRLQANIIEHAYLAYYERFVTEINNARAKNNGGPPTLAFSAVIRNAFAHGGTIHFTKPKPPATWRGLSYSMSDNGRQVMHQDMSLGDVILLMLDMDVLF
jgi:hypothetical protein